jgi:hypothetical protein
MHRKQGNYLNQDALEKIIILLRESELPMSAIAARMSCTRASISAVNRKWQIRNYKGLRSRWVLN